MNPVDFMQRFPQPETKYMLLALNIKRILIAAVFHSWRQWKSTKS